MELKKVKSILQQTTVGELLTDGMSCSEPLLSIKDGALIDNFFVFMEDWENSTVSGPVARVGLRAEDGVPVYLLSCEEQTFSCGSRDTLAVTYGDISPEEYAQYERLYAKLRCIAYKRGCTEEEIRVVTDYMDIFGKIVPPEMMIFYKEMTPAFFEWAQSQSN